MSCGQDNRGALHTFSISFAFAYSQVRSNTMSKQSLEETVKLRNTSAYDSKVSVLSIIGDGRTVIEVNAGTVATVDETRRGHVRRCQEKELVLKINPINRATKFIAHRFSW